MRILLILLLLSNVITVHYPTDNYCTICSSGTHIMCKYKKGPSLLCYNYKASEINNENAKASIVQIHNKFRSKVAQGLESRGNPGPQPPASDMLMLDWDEELEAIAQRIADQCFPRTQKFIDNCRLTSRFSYGIMVASLVHNKNMPLDFEYVFNYWYNNVERFNATKTSKFETSLNGSNQFRYYTQMLWGKTRYIGCGHAVFQEEKQPESYFIHRLVCLYGPEGNIVGVPVYKEGETCSLCPEGYWCNIGLCTNITVDLNSAEDGLINQMEIDLSKDLKLKEGAACTKSTPSNPEKWKEKSTATTPNPNSKQNIVSRGRSYNEGDECYCGYIMRTRNLERSLILEGNIVLCGVSTLIALLFM